MAFAEMRKAKGETSLVVNQEFHVSIIYNSKIQKQTKYAVIKMVMLTKVMV